jgi:hypothetical protein
VDIGWVTVAGSGFVFDGLGLNTVISISFIEGVGTRVSNISTLVL